MSPESAQTIALQALAWLIGNDDLRPVFLGSTGGSAEDLRDRASDSDFQLSVLEFLTMDDNWIIAFCDNVGISYDLPMKARFALPGSQYLDGT